MTITKYAHYLKIIVKKIVCTLKNNLFTQQGFYSQYLVSRLLFRGILQFQFDASMAGFLEGCLFI